MAKFVHDEVDALLAQAQRMEDKGNFEGAVHRYQAAMDLLPKGDQRRDQIQSVVDFITRTRLPETKSPIYAPEEPYRSRTSIPLWLWSIAVLGILLAVCLIAAAGYFAMSRQSPAIPSLMELAPTKPAALAPTVQVLPQEAPTPTIVQTRVFLPTGSGKILFQETFADPGLDPAHWQIDNSAGTQIEAGNGSLLMASSASHEPYVHSLVNPFPTSGDFRANLRFRFPEIGTCGSAVAMSSFVLPAGRSKNETDQLSRAAEQAGGVSIWFWHNVIYYRSGPTSEDISVQVNPTDWRDVTVDYAGGVYRISVNGNPLYTSPETSARPSVLWMGLPFDLGGSGCAWDTLEVSQITVQTFS